MFMNSRLRKELLVGDNTFLNVVVAANSHLNSALN